MTDATPAADPVLQSRPNTVAASANVSHRMTIVGAVACGIGLVGFLVGVGTPVVPQRSVKPAASGPLETSSATPVPGYRELATTAVGPNATWQSSFAALRQHRPGLFDAVIRTPEMKAAALQDRLRTRAFDGAPPVVPHPVDQQSWASCLVCHQEGMQLGNRIATRMSHPQFGSCTQCHVEATSSGPVPADADSEIGNLFAGRLRSGAGDRAAPGAPPTIPHTTQLRTNCLSCHGLIARAGLRTTHPWLQNCLQCHAPSAEFDQQPETVYSQESTF